MRISAAIIGVVSLSTVTHAFVQHRSVQPLATIKKPTFSSIVKSPVNEKTWHNNDVVNFSSTAQKASEVPYPLDGSE